MKTTELISNYKKLYDVGTITSDEYSYLKKHLLDMGNRELDDSGDILLTSGGKDKLNKTNNKIKIAVFIVIAILVAALVGCVNFIKSSTSSGPDYETYYQDDNDNGKLDKGEWNWTQDEDGNVVDIDNDGSNFEFDN